jgi:hypothetical protein
VLGQRALVHDPYRGHRHAVVLDPRVEPVRGRAAGCPEEGVEAAVHGPAADRAREVDSLHRIEPVAVDRVPLCVEEGQPHMPLAHARGSIARVAQDACESGALRLDEAGAARSREDAAIPRPEGHAPRHDAVARRSADGRGTVRVREPQALGRQLVEVRRGRLRLVVVAAEVSVPEVVGEDEEDVGLLGVLSRERRRAEGEEGREEQEAHGPRLARDLPRARGIGQSSAHTGR